MAPPGNFTRLLERWNEYADPEPGWALYMAVETYLEFADPEGQVTIPDTFETDNIEYCDFETKPGLLFSCHDYDKPDDEYFIIMQPYRFMDEDTGTWEQEWRCVYYSDQHPSDADEEGDEDE